MQIFILFAAAWLQVHISGDGLFCVAYWDATSVWCLVEFLYVLMAVLTIL